MKIKTKKEMNLPELIEWIEKNRRFGETFDSNRYNYVDVNVDGVLSFTGNFCEDIFTVEIEEEITEDTVIPKMLVIGRFDGYDKVYNQKLSSFNQHLLSAYLIHDDGHMELIYNEEKGLVG